MSKVKKDTISLKAKKTRRTWSKEIRSNNVTNRISVEELDNPGFLVVYNKYGEDTKGKYFDITKKFYSKTNPLEPEENVMDKAFGELVRVNNS